LKNLIVLFAFTQKQRLLVTFRICFSSRLNKLFFLYTVALKFENVVFPDSVGFRCQNCGGCCHVQPPEVDISERKLIEAKGFTDFLDRRDETGVMWIRRKKDGSCFFLMENNKCAIYDVRPAICRLEPFTVVDYDFERNRIELELNFPAACGCKGVFEGQPLPVEVIGQAAQAIVRKILALTAKDLGLPISNKRVVSETRARILRRGVELADLQV
jgi:Fe-S-cluster containining protein